MMRARLKPPQFADVCKRAVGAIALGAGVLAFGIFAGAPGAARAQSTGELSPGMLMNRGWYAGAVPPIGVVDGRRVVLVSAPESQYVVVFGPFMTGAECSSAISEYSRGSLSDSDYYEAFKMGKSLAVDEAQILADVQKRNVRCIVSDASERFRTPGRFSTDPTTEFVK
jgi:hypothetical protein